MSDEPKLPVTHEELEQYLATTKSRMPGVRVAEMLLHRRLQFDRPSQIIDLMTRAIATLNGSEDETELTGSKSDCRRRKSYCGLLHARAYARYLVGDFDNAKADAAEVRVLARELDDPAVEASILDLMGGIAYRTRDSEKAQEMYEAAFEISIRINDATGITRSLHHLSGMYTLQGNNDKAIQTSGIALERLRELENSEWEIVMVLNGRGRSFYDAERNGEALDTYREAQMMAQRHGHTYFEIRAQEGCAHVYSRLGNYAAALEECRSALNLAQERSLFAHASFVESTIGTIYVRMADERTAAESFTRSIALAEMAGNGEALLSARVRLAEIEMRAGKGEEALAIFQEALDFYQQREDLSTIAYFLSRIAKAQGALGRTDEAEDNYRRAISMAVEMRMNERIAEWSWLLGELHANAGEDGKALPCFEQALTHANTDYPAKLTVDIYAALWDLYERTGRTSEALDISRRHRLAAARVASQLAGEELRNVRVLYDMDTLKNDAEIAGRNQRKAEEDMKDGVSRLEQALFQLEEMRETVNALQEDLKTALTAFDSAHVDEGITILKRVQRSLDQGTGADERDIASFSTIDKAFRERLQTAYPTLTATQVRLCGLLHAGYPNKTVASILHITPGAVKKSRYRLRTFFDMESAEKLETFLAAL